MNQVEQYIAESRKKCITHDLQVMSCTHEWFKHGFGYKCCKCGEYTGLNSELNGLIVAQLNKERWSTSPNTAKPKSSGGKAGGRSRTSAVA